MTVFIEAEKKFDPRIMGILFEEGPKFTIEISTYGDDDTQYIRRKIQGLIVVYEMDSPKLDFKIDYSAATTVKLVGNISDAMTILLGEKVFSNELGIVVNSHDAVKQILQASEHYEDPDQEQELSNAIKGYLNKNKIVSKIFMPSNITKEVVVRSDAEEKEQNKLKHNAARDRGLRNNKR